MPCAALALDNIPVSMFFAVFEASVESQEHVGEIAKSLCESTYSNRRSGNR
jgi:hypothetical protein